jgi:rhodanese-related sulfurtransferase
MATHYISFVIFCREAGGRGLDMDQVQVVLEQGAQRGASLAAPYSGALLPSEAYYLMQHLSGAVLVDVRCAAEWQFVGHVPNAVCIEWKTYPGMQPNPQFVAQLARLVEPEATVMMMCRTGMRSDEAARAAFQAGYGAVYNVLEGFEGEKDSAGQRGRVSGWKARGLPWMQS